MLENLIADISAKITEQVKNNLTREVSTIFKNGFKPCYSEEETAKLLFMSVKTLRRECEENAIGFSFYRGKRVFQPHNILDYLSRNEIKTGRQNVTLKDTLSNVYFLREVA